MECPDLAEPAVALLLGVFAGVASRVVWGEAAGLAFTEYEYVLHVKRDVGVGGEEA